jgi:sulfite reductase (NADPH) hemoprotein beta-component
VISAYFKVISLRSNADPFQSPLSAVRQGGSVSVITTPEPLLLAIPHLYKLSSYSIVIHVLLTQSPVPDYSAITALRQTGFAILQSTSLQEAQDMAIAAHSLALASRKGVIHFSELSHSDSPISEENPEIVQTMLKMHQISKDVSIERSHDSIYRRDVEDQASAMKISVQPAEAKSSPGISSAPITPNSNGNNANDVNNGQLGSPISSTNSVDGSGEKDIARFSPALTDDIFALLAECTGRQYHPFEYFGPLDAQSAIVFFGSHADSVKFVLDEAQPGDPYYGMGLVLVRFYRPWLASAFLASIPRDLKRMAIVEQLRHRPTKWGPVFMDILTSSRAQADTKLTLVSYQLGRLNPDSIVAAVKVIATNLQSDDPQQNITIGQPFLLRSESRLEQPHLENAYVKVLRQLFAENLNVLNVDVSAGSSLSSEIASAPEYILGAYLARKERRGQLISEVLLATREGQVWENELNELMSRWVTKAAQGENLEDHLVADILGGLRQRDDFLSKKLLSDPWLFKDEVPWIIGSEAWAYDLGSSGVHHLLAAGKNVNMLVIDSQPFSQKAQQNLENRKKDIGLYAMNFGNAYVASVAVYSSYTHVMHAMVEAQKFSGPSIILAYLPYTTELDSPLELLQETKLAVDSGYWPLYRWSPAFSSNEDPVFQLDSERVKKELKAFIDRQNHLTHLVKENVTISTTVSHSHGSELRRLRKVKAKEAMDKLMDGLSGSPVTILFASDGGNAENLSKRIGRRGKARGLKPKILAMDDFPVEELSNEKNVIFCTSTAGQGEFPQNGRELWDALKTGTDIDLSKVHFAVFALGDSHYWPRKEDKLYYNKPGKDLDARLEVLGGHRLIDVGLGDDQDPDGFETGYAVWEPKLWKALGADQVDADFEEPKPLTNEDIKIASNFLRGTIAEGLEDTATGAITESDAQLTKFHGIYMQDDRDLREERKAQGLEPAYSFMVRVRMSAGVCQPEQWTAMDKISNAWGNQTFKLVRLFSMLLLTCLQTTRQTFQFHGYFA